MVSQSRLLIQMAGAPGSGKSSLARALATELGAAVLDLDIIKSACLNAGLPWASAGQAAYESLFALAADNIGCCPVIVDAPSYWPDIPTQLAAIAAEAAVTHIFVECVCPDRELIDKRLRQRDGLRSQMPSLDGQPRDAAPYVDADGRPEAVHDRVTYRPDCLRIEVDTSTGESSTALARGVLASIRGA